jgi:3-hydroxyacyl-CoA dehydrogenase
LKVEEIRAIGIIGAGLMGHGIAQVFALKRYKVKLFDNDPIVLQSAPEKIHNNLQTFLEMHLVEPQEIEDWNWRPLRHHKLFCVAIPQASALV